MALGIGQYSGIQQNYIQSSGKTVGSSTVSKQQSEQAAAAASVQKQDAQQGMDIHEISSSDTEKGQRKAHSTIKPSDFSMSFLKNNDFGNLSSESSLGSSDIQKAISDMRKDSVLQEYQYFVGSSQNMIQYASEDGTVIQKS